jgi:hypothetical protein
VPSRSGIGSSDGELGEESASGGGTFRQQSNQLECVECSITTDSSARGWRGAGLTCRTRMASPRSRSTARTAPCASSGNAVADGALLLARVDEANR